MTLRVSLLKGGLKLGTGQLIAQASSFVKSLIVARFISPQNYGIASIFAITVSLMEMISSLSAQTLLVQSQDGDDPRFENTIHFIHAIRGVLNAAVIFLLARPVSYLFGCPQARVAFECLSLIPLLRGFYHLDLNRFQRAMRFGPFVFADAGSTVIVALLAFPAAFWLRDYWAMLWLLVGQSVFYLVASHFLSERRYGWAWDRNYTSQMVRFGWPLLINGLLMFVIFDGDRIVIGSAHRMFPKADFTLSDLGIYSVGYALALAPSTVIGNICTSLFLPLLSRAQALRSQFERRYVGCMQVVSLAASLMAIGFIVAGGRMVSLIYGQKYAGAGVFVGWLSAMWGVRLLRVVPSVASMAYGDTRNPMISNLTRASGLVSIFIVAALGHGLIWIAICGFAGELLALGACVWHLQVHHGIRAALSLKAYTAFFGGAAVSGVVAAAGTTVFGIGATLAIAFVLGVIQIVAMLSLFSGLREDLAALVRNLRSSAVPADMAA